MEYDQDFIFKKLKKREGNKTPKKEIIEPKNKSGKNKEKIIIGGAIPADFFSTPLTGTISFD
jgi:hypothetical protein